MREATSFSDLEHAHAAFDAWRASQPRRRRIPEHLWLQALSLLDRYSISHVAHALRLDPQQLRQCHLAAEQPLPSNPATRPSFIELHPSDLSVGVSTSVASCNSSRHTAHIDARLIFERVDGCRLTLCLPASDWDRLTALCQGFMHG